MLIVSFFRARVINLKGGAMRMLKIIVAGLLMAGGPETLAQNPPEVKWMSVEEALKDPFRHMR